MNEAAKKRWGFFGSGAAVLAIIVLGVALAADVIRYTGNQTLTKNNCKQVILSLNQYSANLAGLYPDCIGLKLKTANDVFRELFRERIISDERIFAGRESNFKPDNEMGLPPKFEKALMPGECHWMLLKNQTSLAHPKTPIVIENSLATSWPPKWDMANTGFGRWRGMRTTRGRCWSNRTIVIGRNDGSVDVEKLLPDGTLDWHSPNNLGPDGKSWIDALTLEQIAKLAYWDVEEK